MPKPHTFPTLFDDAFQISITELKEWGYFRPEQMMRGAIVWKRGKYERGRISIEVDTIEEEPFIELKYKYRDEPRKYKVRLVTAPSNLGKGVIWYFLCPTTNKRCRKLYSVGGYFLHREAFKDCMYESQTRSKKFRLLDSTLGLQFKSEDLHKQLTKKHFKKYYAGKPTKRYLRIMQQIQKAEDVSFREVGILFR